jgi:hypothetical protein
MTVMRPRRACPEPGAAGYVLKQVFQIRDEIKPALSSHDTFAEEYRMQEGGCRNSGLWHNPMADRFTKV